MRQKLFAALAASLVMVGIAACQPTQYDDRGYYDHHHNHIVHHVVVHHYHH